MFLRWVYHLRPKDSDETNVDVFFFFDCEKFNIAAYASHGEARTGVMYIKTINEITRKYFLNRLVTLNLKHYKEI